MLVGLWGVSTSFGPKRGVKNGDLSRFQFQENLGLGKDWVYRYIGQYLSACRAHARSWEKNWTMMALPSHLQ